MGLSELFRQELSLDLAIQKSRELADLVKQDYSPDLVVAIATGGVLPAHEISNRLGVDYAELVIRRKIDLREIYEKIPRALSPFVKLYQGYLFMTINPSLINEGDFICEGLNVLLVDDTIHTGKTVHIARDNLIKRGAKQIRSAAINYVEGHKPNYSVTRGRIKFPWSKNSKDYRKFASYVRGFSETENSSCLQLQTT